MNYRHTLLSLLLLIIPVAALPSLALATDAATAPAQTGGAAPPAAPQTAAEDKAKAPAINGEVTRAVFTTGIKDREPVDKITTLTNDKDKIYFFTEIHNMSGHIVKHRWVYNGKTMAEVEFGVGGPRWRVWSTKSLLPQWTGEWKVSVVDEAGKVLNESSFTYTKAK